jgi:argininosuccinate lyase
MPQKKNPDLLELMRGKAARIAGQANTLMIAVKGLPLAYNKDLQETQEPLFDATETALAVLPMAAGFTRGVEFDFARMEQAAKTGFLNAWAAATYLVRQGVPFRLAHEQTGKAVQLCLEKGCEIENLSVAELESINPAFGPDFQAALSLEAVLDVHDVLGGTAPVRVRQAIAAARTQSAALREGVHAHA